MNTDKLDEGSRMLETTSWRAIAMGVFVALALQILLVDLGLAFGLSVGDRMIEGGFALWALIAVLASLIVGGAIAARVSHALTRNQGIGAGVLTWAVAIVIGNLFSRETTLGGRLDSTSAWAVFFGALLGLGAAALGGAIAVRRGPGERAVPLPPYEPTAHTP